MVDDEFVERRALIYKWSSSQFRKEKGGQNWPHLQQKSKKTSLILTGSEEMVCQCLLFVIDNSISPFLSSHVSYAKSQCRYYAGQPQVATIHQVLDNQQLRV